VIFSKPQTYRLISSEFDYSLLAAGCFIETEFVINQLFLQIAIFIITINNALKSGHFVF